MGAVASCLSGNGRHLLAAAHQGDAASVREVQPGGGGVEFRRRWPLQGWNSGRGCCFQGYVAVACLVSAL